MDRKHLSILLSNLKNLEELNINLEQYQTEGELAGGVLWDAFLNNNIEGKIIADLGCGNGILGIGALLLGAKKVYFADVDKNAVKIARENYKKLKLKNGVFLSCDINEFNKKVDTVLMNPPFGVQNEHSDKIFLEKAMGLSNVIYSFHKIESKKFIGKLSLNYGFSVVKVYKYKMLIKQVYKFHKQKSYYVDVGLWQLRRNL